MFKAIGIKGECKKYLYPEKAMKTQCIKKLIEKFGMRSKLLIMKKCLIVMTLMTFVQLSFSQTIVNLNFWQISTNSIGSILYPGNFSNSIKPFDSFLNSVSRNENGVLETYIPNSSSNPFELFEPGKSYIFDLKEDLNVIYIPGFDYSSSIPEEEVPWFIFPGNVPVPLNNFDKIDYVIRYDSPESGVLSYSPRVTFPFFRTFESGGRYFVDNNNQEFLVPFAVPEPSALSLFVVGLGGLAMMRRRRS